ncbi:MAG: hypothetical protein KIT09_21885 [Bryobacteraceae bacterium]|nr:hypothetical protein [Bryobacteraceae bacterium]
MRVAALALLAAATGHAFRQAGDHGVAGRAVARPVEWPRTIAGITVLRQRAYEGGVRLAVALPRAQADEESTKGLDEAGQEPPPAPSRGSWSEYVR